MFERVFKTPSLTIIDESTSITAISKILIYIQKNKINIYKPFLSNTNKEIQTLLVNPLGTNSKCS
jgi:hypothetical protein